jgi:molecular chaperone DnaK (HSP70)
VGIGIDVEAAQGNMIVDIGGGSTEIAVISLGGIVSNNSIRVAGDEITADIQNYMSQQHNVKVSERMAERIKKNVGSALTDLSTDVKQTTAQFSSLKAETAAQFAPVMIDPFHNLQQLIAGAKTELKKPEIRNAIKKLGTAVSELLAKGVNTALKLLPKLARAAEFLVSNLKPLVITFGSLWAIFKTVSIVTKAIDAFKTLKAAMVALKTATTTATAAQVVSRGASAGARSGLSRRERYRPLAEGE